MKSKKPFFNILFAANSYKSSSSIPKPKQPQITYKHVQYSHLIFRQNKLYSSSTTTTPPHSDSAKPNGDSDEPIDAGSSIRKPISLWPGMYHSPVTNALWEARSNIYEPKIPAHDNNNTNNNTQVLAKPPSKSRTSVVYKFSTDYMLREQYRNPWNRMRMGKLVEDLDALAGTISFKVYPLSHPIVNRFSSMFDTYFMMNIKSTSVFIV